MISLDSSVFIESMQVVTRMSANGGGEVEEEPDHLHHLDIGSLGEIVTHVDKHGGNHKHSCDIDRDDGGKKEFFEIV